MEKFDIQQVSTHLIENSKGLQLVVVVSRLAKIEELEFSVSGNTFSVSSVTPLDCYYINTIFIPDKTVWETYDRLEAEHVPAILDEIKSNFLNPKYSDL